MNREADRDATRHGPLNLGLGTAQFGSDYGITNRAGRPSEAEIARIVERALGAGITVFDTAPAYGESEAILGRLLPADPGLRIVTKTAAIDGPAIDERRARTVGDAFKRSLERLRRDRVDTLLIHDVAALRLPGAPALADQLRELREQGLVARLGISIYEAAELAAAESLLAVEVIQAPVNLIDRRLLRTAWLAGVSRRGIAIHARSVFWQGLLLAEPATVPAALAAAREPLGRIDAQRMAAGLSRAEAALGFVLAMPEIEVALVGANTEAELGELIDAARADARFDPDDPGVSDPGLLDPRRWPGE